MFKNHLSLSSCTLVAFTALILNTGCMARDGGDWDGEDSDAELDPDTVRAGDWSLHRTCLYVRDCAAEVQDCQAHRIGCDDFCRPSCTSGTGASCANCIEVCSRRPPCSCDGADGVCTTWDYEFTHENATPDPRIEAACLAMFESCPVDGFNAARICPTFAANENPDVAVGAYECFATHTCDASECRLPADYATADRICVRAGGDTNWCRDARELLAHDAPWWSPATREGALLCAGQRDISQCVNAFLQFTRTALP